MASIFTRIIQGEIPCYKVAEDDRYFAFLDINPLTEGHTLVVPKKETDYLFDLDDDTLAGMVLFAKRIAKRIGEKITCMRFIIVVQKIIAAINIAIRSCPIGSEGEAVSIRVLASRNLT